MSSAPTHTHRYDTRQVFSLVLASVNFLTCNMLCFLSKTNILCLASVKKTSPKRSNVRSLGFSFFWESGVWGHFLVCISIHIHLLITNSWFQKFAFVLFWQRCKLQHNWGGNCMHTKLIIANITLFHWYIAQRKPIKCHFSPKYIFTNSHCTDNQNIYKFPLHR